MFRISLKWCLIFIGIGLVGCSNSQEPIVHLPKVKEKINGLSLVASPDPIDSVAFQQMDSVHANWISVMPFAFMYAKNAPKLVFNQTNQWWGERVDGVRKTIELAHSNQQRVCVKPQIWIGSGDFTGFISMKNEEDWLSFEKNYSTFILAFAQVAQETNAEYFCIGTELQLFVEKRPAFWTQLIADIRNAYKGKLTYAENWDCFDKVPFWADLDAIGVDAYFPLSDKRIPSVKSLKKAWIPHLEKLKTTAGKYARPIVFTEYGYRSMDYCTKKPWDFSESHAANEQTQSNALEALYQTCWQQDWFAGGFLWKWFPEDNRHLGEDRTQFSPQGKKATEIVKKYYFQYQKV